MSFFLEYGEDSRFLIKILALIVTIESIVIMGLGFLAVKQRIIYINPSQVVGSTYVGYVPEEMVTLFGTTFVYFLGNANQYSVGEQYKSAYLLMSPKLQSAMKRTLEGDIAEITKSDMSIQTIPTDCKVKGDGQTFTLIIEAARLSFVYGQETKREKLLYNIRCQKAATRKSNPFGLEVTAYDNQVVAIGNNPTVGERQ
ncbi:MAG: TraE/TraK family type IV conjugative transfer system protein [Nitrospiraceae bacterium]|nr:TraE/TraK family type IV conjugative transfer system protein [Nitrospiraceae bacterium]